MLAQHIERGALVFLETVTYNDVTNPDGVDIRFFTDGMFGDNTNWNALPEHGAPRVLETCGFEVLEYNTWDFNSEYKRALAVLRKKTHQRHTQVSYPEFIE